MFLAGATPLGVLGRKTRESLGTICKKLWLSIYGRYDPTTHPNSAAAAKRSAEKKPAAAEQPPAFLLLEGHWYDGPLFDSSPSATSGRGGSRR